MVDYFNDHLWIACPARNFRLHRGLSLHPARRNLIYAKPLTTFLGNVHFGYLITVCSRAEKDCPIFPGVGMRLHWPLEDPAACQGGYEETLEKFREIRDQIDLYVREWLDKQGN